MKPIVRRGIERADATVIRLLGELGVATVHEAQQRSGLMRPYMRPIYAAARLAGSAVTVSCQPGDNLMIHAAMDVVQAAVHASDLCCSEAGRIGRDGLLPAGGQPDDPRRNGCGSSGRTCVRFMLQRGWPDRP